jgi:YD repeat-containing protein
MNRLRLARKENDPRASARSVDSVGARVSLSLTFANTFVLSRSNQPALLSRQTRRYRSSAFNWSKECHVNVSAIRGNSVSRRSRSLFVAARQVIWSLAVMSSSLALASLIAGCHGSQSLTNDMAVPAAETKMQTSPLAAAVIERARQLHPSTTALAHLKLRGARLPIVASALAESQADEAHFDAAAIRAHLHAASSNGNVAYPQSADGPRTLVLKSGSAVSLTLQNATTSSAEYANGYIVYRNGLSAGGHVIVRPSHDGFEDHFYFEKKPSASAVDYVLALPPAVAGLRLTNNALELLDSRGTPLLHSSPPFLVDAAGRTSNASVAVSGCAVDRSSQPSFGRKPIPLGATNCRVEVTWNDAAIQYPAILDPSWTTGNTMSVPRAGFSTAVITKGSPQIIAVGGFDGSQMQIVATVDFFDVATRTWSLGPSLNATRGYSQAVYNPTTNEVLVSGGINWADASFESSTEILSQDPTTGAWSWTLSAPMRHSRAFHTATLLATAQVLIAGGGNDPNETANCDLYDFATHQMVSPPPPDMSQTRNYAFAAAVSNGQAVLVSGGLNMDQDPVSPPGRTSAELYIAASRQWVSVPDMPAPHGLHSGVKLSDDTVIIMGGDDARGFQNEADIFSFISTSPPYGVWSKAGTVGAFGKVGPAALLPNGAVLFASGTVGTAPYGTYSDGEITTEADLYDPSTNTWTQTVPEAVGHQDGAAQTVSYNGTNITVVFGGSASGTDITNVTEIFSPTQTGQTCTGNAECAGGFCVSGTCCTSDDCSGDVFTYQIDARALAQNTFTLQGFSTPFSTRTVQTVQLAPGPHSILIPGLPTTEHVDFSITNGTIAYAPSLEGVLSGRGTRTLTISGRTVTIDARALSQPNIALSILDPTSQLISTATPTSLALLPAHGYGFTLGTGVTANFAFDVDNGGSVNVASSYAGIAAAAGNTLTLKGAHVSISATATNTSMAFAGLYGTAVSIPTGQTSTLNLMPLTGTSLYNFVVGSNEVTTFGFNLDLPGNFQYDAKFDGYVLGRGTSALTINAPRIIVDGSVDGPGQFQIGPIFGIIGGFDRSRLQAFDLMPVVNGYTYSDDAGTFAFLVNEDGTIGYATTLDGEFSGRGTSVLIDAANTCIGLTPAEAAALQSESGWLFSTETCFSTQVAPLPQPPVLLTNTSRVTVSGAAPAVTPKAATRALSTALGVTQGAHAVAGGDPVLVDGEFYIQRTDAKLGGVGVHYEFKRTYRSQTEGTGPLGSSWDHNYNKRIAIDAAYYDPSSACYQNAGLISVDYSDGELNTVHFKQSTPNTFVAPLDPGLHLQQLAAIGTPGPTWKLTDVQGNVLIFDQSGSLMSISDPAGNRLSFTWTTGQLSTVTDPSHRTITYVYRTDNPSILDCVSLGTDCSSSSDVLVHFDYVKDSAGTSYLSHAYRGHSIAAEQYIYSLNAVPTTPTQTLPSDCIPNPSLDADCKRLCAASTTTDSDSCFNANAAGINLGNCNAVSTKLGGCTWTGPPPPFPTPFTFSCSGGGTSGNNEPRAVGPCMAYYYQIPWSLLAPNGTEVWPRQLGFTLDEGKNLGLVPNCELACDQRFQCWGTGWDRGITNFLPFYAFGTANDLKNNITQVLDETGRIEVTNTYGDTQNTIAYDRVWYQQLGPTTDLSNTLYFRYHDLDIEANGVEVYSLRNFNYPPYQGSTTGNPDPDYYPPSDSSDTTIWYGPPSTPQDNVLDQKTVASQAVNICPQGPMAGTSPTYHTYLPSTPATPAPTAKFAVAVTDIHGTFRVQYVDSNANILREDAYQNTPNGAILAETTQYNYDTNGQLIGVQLPSGIRNCYELDSFGHTNQATIVPSANVAGGDSTPLVDLSYYDPQQQLIDYYTDVAHGASAMAHAHFTRDPATERITEVDQSGGSISDSAPLVTKYDYNEVSQQTYPGVREVPVTVTMADGTTKNQYPILDPSSGAPQKTTLDVNNQFALPQSLSRTFDSWGRMVLSGETDSAGMGRFAVQYVYDPATTKLTQINHQYAQGSPWISGTVQYHLSDEEVRLDSVGQATPDNSGQAIRYLYGTGGPYPNYSVVTPVGQQTGNAPPLPAPQATCYHYAADGQLQDVLLPEGSQVHYVYDYAGRLTGVSKGFGAASNPTGPWTSGCAGGAPLSGDPGTAAIESRTYHVGGFLLGYSINDNQRSVITDGFGRVIQTQGVTLSANGLPANQDQVAVRQWGYDGFGRVIWEAAFAPYAGLPSQPYQKPTHTTPQLLAMTEYSYDVFGRLTSKAIWDTTQQESNVSTIVRDDQHRMLTITEQVVPWSGNTTDPGRSVVQTFDGVGRLATETLLDGSTTVSTKTVTYSMPAGVFTATVVQQTNQPSPLTRVYQFDTRGNLTAVLDGNNNLLTSTQYDDANNTVYSQFFGTGARGTTTQTRDRFGRIVHVDQGSLNGVSIPTDYAWDLQNRLHSYTTYTNGSANTWTTTYSGLDQPLSISGPLGRSTTYLYATGFGTHLLGTSDSYGRQTCIGYDEDFRPGSKFSAPCPGNQLLVGPPPSPLNLPDLEDRSYTPLGQLQLIYAYQGPARPSDATAHFTYDSLGRVIDQVIHSIDTTVPSYTIHHDYLDQTRTVQTGITVNEPGAPLPVSFAHKYDALDRLSTVTLNASSPALATYSYGPTGLGGPLSLGYSNGARLRSNTTRSFVRPSLT